ncbi:MAG: hypothetical protein ACJAQ1_001022 [Flavobacterium sp.]|jgi:hypothetical protein
MTEYDAEQILNTAIENYGFQRSTKKPVSRTQRNSRS